ncbi:unnamed protein product [Cladocopium goreaui]|uniref:Uncharacterized protein n=1 Tax=Cladocopium goreaui TaxID=2562237 RepID=A0A9P1D344_9DINO|nr:unnamed protein product [Cladocopium goreaui]
MRRTVMRFAQKTSQRHGERLDSSSGFPDAAQWALTVGLGTLIPGFALFKLFTVTGAVEAEKGAQEEHMCNQEKNNINFMNFHDIPRSWLDTKDTRKLLMLCKRHLDGMK